jgi:glycosyltransferase Alg8
MLLGLYVLALLALAANAPPAVWDPQSREFIIILGVIGAWRYGWGAVHLARSLVYRKVVFPRWRRALGRLAAATPDGAAPVRAAEVYCIVTSYRIRAETTVAVYRALIAELRRYGQPATIVATIVELGDQRLLKRLFQSLSPPDRLRLVLVRLPGTGKRAALATALRGVSRLRPAPGAAVVVMDGDTVLPPGTLEGCLPFLRLMPTVGGITTDEDAVVANGPLMTSWHRLRFAQRHMLLCSLGLSRRLLALTGRMSVIRAELATDPSFIGMVGEDTLQHWRLGRIPLLTGEDKSTWFWLLQRDWDMLYVPDVRVLTIEHPPSPGFRRASSQLMLRWFGNMLRASNRAIALGPRRTGLFLWWCLLDQRVSMWTPLVGPLVTLLALSSHGLVLLYTYLLWVMATRLAQTASMLAVRDSVSGLWPMLIYYNQVYGALLKTYVLFRLDRQRWTRQNIALRPRLRPSELRWRAFASAYLHGLALLALVGGLAFLSGMLTLPGAATLGRMF